MRMRSIPFSSQALILSPCFCVASHFLTLPQRMRTLAERGAPAPTPPASPNAGANTNAMLDYSIYDLAAAMATARQVITTSISNSIARLVRSSARGTKCCLCLLLKVSCAGRWVLGPGDEGRSGGGRGAGEEGGEGDRVLPSDRRAPHRSPRRVGARGALLLPVRRRRRPHHTAAGPVSEAVGGRSIVAPSWRFRVY